MFDVVLLIWSTTSFLQHFQGKGIQAYQSKSEDLDFKKKPTWNCMSSFVSVARPTEFTAASFVLWQVVEELLSLDDVVQFSQVSRKTKDLQRSHEALLRFARDRFRLGGETSLKDWRPVYEACLRMAQQCGLDEHALLGKMISFKHTWYDDASGQCAEPLDWRFKPGSVEPFMKFLWKEYLSEPSSSPRNISAGTFVKVLSPCDSAKIGEPLAVIALDATYCEDGPKDEFFHMVSLLLLDDRKVALILAFADEITENECLFSIVLVGEELFKLIDHAARMFESPAWSLKGHRLQWFGWDMSSFDALDKRIELLYKLGLEPVLQKSIWLDLEDFGLLMQDLCHCGLLQIPTRIFRSQAQSGMQIMNDVLARAAFDWAMKCPFGKSIYISCCQKLFQGKRIQAYQSKSEDLDFKKKPTWNCMSSFVSVACPTEFTAASFVLWQVVEELLSLDDVVQFSQVSRKTKDLQRSHEALLRFARDRFRLGGETSLKDWRPVYEACLRMAQQCGLDEHALLGKMISFKHTWYDGASGQCVEPLDWRFKPGSVEPFMKFLWKEYLSEPSSSPRNISAGTFVKVLSPCDSAKIGKPLAVIALDATYCEDGPKDEFFHMVSLLLLDDRKVALILAFADEITENECLFSIVLVGEELFKLIDHAARMFESPAWSLKGHRLQWFGWDMSSFDALDKRIELLYKLGLEPVLQKSIWLDLEDFGLLMQDLCPEDA